MFCGLTEKGLRSMGTVSDVDSSAVDVLSFQLLLATMTLDRDFLILYLDHPSTF